MGYRSTANPPRPRAIGPYDRWLVDPNTGAPVGVENPNAGGEDGIFFPIPVTAAEIATPPAAMLADNNATFALNVAPFTRYRSTGTILVELDMTGAGGGTFSGPVTFADGSVWSSTGVVVASGSAITLAKGTIAAPAITFTGHTTVGLSVPVGASNVLQISATSVALYPTGGTQISLTLKNGFGAPYATGAGVIAFGENVAGAIFAYLGGESTGVISLSNATNANEFRVYGTTTGPAYVSLKHDGTNGAVSTTVGAINLTPFTNVVITTGELIFSAATSRIVPGATSLSLRNTADSADNILIADAGGVTFRGALSGATTLSLAGPITLTAATSQIVPGATSLSLRNTANSADNLLIVDAGAATFRTSVAVTTLLDLSAAGAGNIKFPSTANESANANTLDDYSEGTFTPALTFGGAAVSMTFSVQDGVFTKIGNKVTFSARIVLSAKGSSTGTALLTGLPFTSITSANRKIACAIYLTAGATLTTNMLMATIGSAATTVGLFDLAAAAAVVLDQTDFTNTTELVVSGTYYAV